MLSGMTIAFIRAALPINEMILVMGAMLESLVAGIEDEAPGVTFLMMLTGVSNYQKL